ncbi:hypothetical protein [Aliivibrio fischeri]|uniref:hypothetical protein n=1 Tax=Aliivibrio fischeri TaxID=668 RepID=UPI00080EB492|nr:hypothetical protein [Aliivibrio fischeri]OCH36796.1 hypothetical protein A6E02_18820 [Aliivibrio fischeri]
MILIAQETTKQAILDPSYTIECPCCHQSATDQRYDAHDGMSYGSGHYSINCDHCGYHECDNECCLVCALY